MFSFFKKKIIVPHIRLAGVIGSAGRFRQGIDFSGQQEIIKKALMDLCSIDLIQANNLIIEAEKREQESNQIVEFTKEIKKKSMEFRLKIIEILWKIVYSDGTNDIYEANLIRRVCGLLYISDKESGIIKLKVKKNTKVEE